MTATFRPGSDVLVRDDWPEARGPAHIRTPHYARGLRGRVVCRLGAFPNPEDLAFGRPAEPRALYRVAFDRGTIWPGADRGELVLEIFEHWLEAAP